MNEQAFILSLQPGDPQSFIQLVETWQDRVFNIVLSIVQDHAEAEDLSQEVFIQVYQSIAKFRNEAKLSTWLYRIAVSKALDSERKRVRKKKLAGLMQWVGLEERRGDATITFHHPGVTIENKERAAILFEAMRKLPGNQRIAFLLVKTEGLRYEQVSDVMGISVKAVEALIHRAKERLRKQLNDYYTSQNT